MSEGFPNHPVPRPFQPRVPNNNGSPDNSNNTVNNNPVNAPRPVPHNAGNVSNARFNPGAGVNPVVPVHGNNGQVHANPQRPGVAPLRPAVPLHGRVNEDESNAGMRDVRRPVLRPFGDAGVSDVRRKDDSVRSVEPVERAEDSVAGGDDERGVIVRSVGQRGPDRFPREHRVARGRRARSRAGIM